MRLRGGDLNDINYGSLLDVRWMGNPDCSIKLRFYQGIEGNIMVKSLWSVIVFLGILILGIAVIAVTFLFIDE